MHACCLSPHADVQYVAVLYTPSYIKNIKREWNAVFALCPKCSTGITTVGLVAVGKLYAWVGSKYSHHQEFLSPAKRIKFCKFTDVSFSPAL